MSDFVKRLSPLKRGNLVAKLIRILGNEGFTELQKAIAEACKKKDVTFRSDGFIVIMGEHHKVRDNHIKGLLVMDVAEAFPQVDKADLRSLVEDFLATVRKKALRRIAKGGEFVVTGGPVSHEFLE